MTRALASILALLFFAGTARAQFRETPTVTVTGGQVWGLVADGVASFKGIPYAAPPVGPLRWKPPQPVVPWQGVRAGDRSGAVCMQIVPKGRRDTGLGDQPMSEDCLTLNLYAPKGASAAAPVPVMVWIHGGGLVNGSGTADLYDGANLARQGVVVVSINYRLGRFGFFAHPALTAEASGQEALANYGFMDQVAALKWVQANIKAFGGDPAKVTIFGESAGGMSVNRMMMVKDARGLFVRAISESGVGREHSKTLAEAEQSGEAFVAKLGAPHADARALRALPADAILAQGDPELLSGEAPILDGRMLTEDPDTAFRKGHVAAVPYLVGSNGLEFPPIFMPAGAKGLPGLDIAALKAAYPSEAAFKTNIVSDALFGEPARSLAAWQAQRAPVYLYRFTALSATAPKFLTGAPHASDRAYVFDNPGAMEWPADPQDPARARTISAYWVAFAKTGDPNGDGRPVWPRYEAKSDLLMNLANDGPKAVKTPDAATLDAIAKAREGAAK
jgi:para-nitrobenzyl esterase